MTMIDRFYTKNGLPVDEDPEFDYPNRLDIVTIPEGMEFAEAGKQTLRMHLDREPRFYAWVAFQNGYFECLTEKEKMHMQPVLMPNVQEGRSGLPDS